MVPVGIPAISKRRCSRDESLLSSHAKLYHVCQLVKFGKYFLVPPNEIVVGSRIIRPTTLERFLDPFKKMPNLRAISMKKMKKCVTMTRDGPRIATNPKDEAGQASQRLLRPVTGRSQ